MKILFVNPKFNLVTPRNIRARNIITELRNLHADFKIDVLSLDFPDQFKTEQAFNQIEIPIRSFSKRVVFKEHYKLKSNLLYKGVGYLLHLLMIDPYELEAFLNRKYIYDIIQKEDYDVIVVSVIPFSWIKVIPSRYKKKVIFDIGDPLAKNSSSGNFLKRGILNVLRNLKKFEAKSVRSIKHLIVTNSGTKEYYKSLGVNEKDISVIGQGYAPELFSNDSPCPQVNFKGMDKITFSYAGTFYKGLREPDELLKAIISLGNDQLAFQFIGSPSHFFKDHPSKQVYILPKMNQQNCVDILKKSDILIFIDNNEGMQTPGKIYEMLALQKPILFIYTTEISGAFQLLKDYDFVIKAPNTKEAILHALNRISNGAFSFHFEVEISQHSWTNLALSFNNILIQE